VGGRGSGERAEAAVEGDSGRARPMSRRVHAPRWHRARPALHPTRLVGRGIGSRLIDHAKAQSPDGLTPGHFQVNERALGFMGITGSSSCCAPMAQARGAAARRAPWLAAADAGLPIMGCRLRRSPPWDIGRPYGLPSAGGCGALRGRARCRSWHR
jgi:hypothetical protein